MITRNFSSEVFLCRSSAFSLAFKVIRSLSSSEIDSLKKAFTESAGHWSTFIIWAKNTFTLGRSEYQRQYEPILYGARDKGDVWSMNNPVVNDLHPTMKPVELVERAMANSRKLGATVLDAFGGSGTMVIHCCEEGQPPCEGN